MEWHDQGYVVGLSNYGEQDRILTLLTREHGRQSGYLRNAQSATQRGIWQLGNLVSAKWRARLDTQLGHFSGELTTQHAAEWLSDRWRLAALVAACELLARYTPERDPAALIFQSFADMLQQLRGASTAHCLASYVRFEFSLIAQLGYGLDRYSLENNPVFRRLLATDLVTDAVERGAVERGAVERGAVATGTIAKGEIMAGLKMIEKILDRIEQGGSYAALSAKPRARQRLFEMIARHQGNL
ncbi:MAG: DNA repair protein RecO [Candidatus Symbiobacter sp.]|nr:DNA repair protein RecO [Candidatus Symbiobacter sp.]